ncbi:GMC family oxidoreductase, partial [Leptospira borgpetersenii serovar Hardjo-bovis]|uniref:GMC family oxidoreductase n=1 Tax=Leptospira borgpetersenii TaxID=174 RepID=UPI00187EA71F
GVEHREIMKQLPHIGGTIGWIDDVPSELGNISVSASGKRTITYNFGKLTKEFLKDCIRKQAQLNFSAGAKWILLPDLKRTKIFSEKEIDKINLLELNPASMMMAAPHPAGGCRMGQDPFTSVVDWRHRVHGLKNLYVSDSSVFPTGVSVDPSYRIMAFSKQAAKF